jgi:hypothetical protein
MSTWIWALIVVCGCLGAAQVTRFAALMLVGLARWARETAENHDRRRRVRQLTERSRQALEQLEALYELPTLDPRR